MRNFVTAGRDNVQPAADLGDLDEILTSVDDGSNPRLQTFVDSQGNYWKCDDSECSIPYTFCTDV